MINLQVFDDKDIEQIGILSLCLSEKHWLYF